MGEVQIRNENTLVPLDYVIIEHLMVAGVSVPKMCQRIGIDVADFRERMKHPVFRKELLRRIQDAESIMEIRFECRFASMKERVIELERLYDSIPDEAPEKVIMVKVKVQPNGEEWKPPDGFNPEMDEVEDLTEERRQILVYKSNAPLKRDILKAIRDELEPTQHLHTHVVSEVDAEDEIDYSEREKKFNAKFGGLEDVEEAEFTDGDGERLEEGSEEG